MDAAWEELEERWAANNRRMVGLKVRPRTDEEGMLELNVGGSIVRVFWHLLAQTEGFEDSVLGALLHGVWDKGRIPRDADGRIVLDESPTCIKHAIHAMLTGRSSSVAEALPRGAASSAVAIDEAPCLIYTAHVMGLWRAVPTHPKCANVTGGSTALETFEIAPLGAAIREWVGDSTDEMTLIYRATRDGFGCEAFTARCNKDSPKTVSLIRVSSGQANDYDDTSVVGGYSTVPWGSPAEAIQSVTPHNMFLFMLKDGSASRKGIGMPIRWRPGSTTRTTVPRSDGPYFGASDLVTKFDKTSGRCTMHTTEHLFPFGIDSPFLALNGKTVVDVEVYRYSKPAPPTTTASGVAKRGGDVLTDAEAHDIRLFGESIANSLMEERVVLDYAAKEVEAAGERVSAAVGALETVYGPSVAAGEQDAVVELNVRGARMTTLRSTLQACPRSALAVMFDEERWPATDKDKDEHGRRLIDSDPACFSKILDVLRMRKRASRSRGATPETQDEESGGVLPGGVLIKEADVNVFCETVNVYFPGCESFIMDVVR